MRKKDNYLNINDPLLSRTLSLADAYRILERFIVQYNDRGESDTVSLLTDVGLLPDGTTCDPVQLHDFLLCASEILDAKGPK